MIQIQNKSQRSATVITNSINNPKFSGILYDTIVNVIRRRKITFEQFSNMFFETVADKEVSFKNLSAYRNELIGCITGGRKLGFDRFRFIMVDILKEPIPDDTEIIHIRNLGNGVDLRGQKIGMLSFIECVGTNGDDKHLRWRCLCDCGKETIISSGDLARRRHKTISCGCDGRKRILEASITHGKSKSSEYGIWRGIKKRCLLPSVPSYKHYGGRGITICDRWRDSFENFYEDMGDRPKGMSIERRDNDGHYCTENCYWATNVEQHNNTRRTMRLDDGTPFKVWARKHNIPYHKARYNFRRGMSPEEILKKFKPEIIIDTPE